MTDTCLLIFQPFLPYMLQHIQCHVQHPMLDILDEDESKVSPMPMHACDKMSHEYQSIGQGSEAGAQQTLTYEEQKL